MSVQQESLSCDVHTVDQPMSTAAPVAPSAASVGANGATVARRLTARIRAAQARVYLRDLAEWAEGDVSRFDRMVDGCGGGIGSAGAWLRNLRNIVTNEDVIALFPDLPGEVGAQLAAMGLELSGGKE